MNDIEKRIVEMQFDNAQFEQGIGTSLKSLDALKQGLKLDKAGKSLENLNRAGKKVSFSNLSDNVEFVAKKFTALGIMGVTAMQRISDSILTTGKRLVSAFTIDPVKSGLREYETQIGAIQTILSNTRSKGGTLDSVNKALDELNYYADKTIYNFTEMARNIGTFTAAGVDLETSTQAIKGIANLAAVSGSTSQQASVAMYQLSQALASGTVRLMDWNSVVNAGMGGEVFQNALKETARVHGINIDAMIKKEGSFRETLKDGWLTASIMTETLSKFTGDLSKEQILSMGYTEEQADQILALGKDASEAATKVKTFSQLIDTLKEALGSGWAQTWRAVIGDFEEARTLWTSVSDAIGGVIENMSESRNNLLSGWKEAGGRDDLLKGLTDVFTALWGIVVAVGDAMDDIFPDTTVDDLLALSRGVKEFGEKLKTVLWYKEQWSKTKWVNRTLPGLSEDKLPSTDLKIGAKGEEVKKLQEALSALGYNVGEVDGIFGKKTKAALEAYQKAKGLIEDGLFGEEERKTLGEGISLSEKITETMLGFSSVLEKVQRIANGALAILDIGLKGLKFLGDVILVVADALSPIGDLIITLAAYLGDFFVGIHDGIEAVDPFTAWLELIRGLLVPVKAALQVATKAILKFFGFGETAGKAISKVSEFSKILESIKGFLFGSETPGNKGLFAKIGEILNSVSDWVSKTELAKSIVNKLKNIVETISTILFGTKDNIRTGETGEPNIIKRIGMFFKGISKWYSESEAVRDFLNRVKEIVKDISEFLFGTKDNVRTGETGKPNIIQRLETFFKGLYEWYSKTEFAQKLTSKIKEIIKTINEFLFGTKDNIRTGETGEPNIIQRLRSFFEGLYEWYNKSEIAKKVVDKVREIVKAISEVLFGTKDNIRTGETGKPSIIKRIGDFFTWISDWYSKSEEAQAFVEKLKEIFQSVKEFVFGTDDNIRTGETGKPNIFQRIDDFFKWVSDIYQTLKGNDKVKKVIESIKTFYMSIYDAITAFFSNDEKTNEKSATSNNEGPLSPFVKVYESTKRIWNSVVEWLEGAYRSADEFLNNVGTGGLIGMILAAMGILSIAKTIKGVKRVFKSLGEVADVFTSKFKKGIKVQPLSRSILEIAAAIGLIVAAIYVIGTMDDGQLTKGLLVVGGIFLALATLTFLMKKFVKTDDADSIDKVGKSILNFALAIGVIAAAIIVFGLMDGGLLLKGGGIVIAILGIFATFSILMRKYGSTKMEYAGLIGMAVAIGILGLIAWMLGKMDSTSLAQGLISLTSIMLVLGLFMAIVNKYGGSSTVEYKGLFSLVLAVGILAGLVVLLSKIDWSEGWKGAVALVGLMAALGVFMVFVNNKGGSSNVKYAGLIALAVAIGILAGVVILLGGMRSDAMWRGVGAIVILMGAVAGLMYIMNKANEKAGVASITQTLVFIFGFIALITAFSIAINLIKDVDPMTMVAFSASFALALGALVTALLVAGNDKFGGVKAMSKGAAGIGAAIAILITIVGGIITALGGINEFTNKGFEDTLKSGGDVLRSIGRAIGSLIGGVRDGILGIDGMDETTTELESITGTLDSFSAAIDGLKASLGILFLAAAVSGFSSKSFALMMGALDVSLALFALTGALSIIVWGLGQVNIWSEKNFVKTIEEGGEVLYNLGKALGKLIGGIKDGFQKETELEQYTQNVKDYSAAVSSLNTSLKEIGANTTIDDDIEKAMSVTQKLKDYFDSMDRYAINFEAMAGYETAPGQLSTDMGAFAEAISIFNTKAKTLGNPIELFLNTLKAIGLAAILHSFFSGMKSYPIDRTGFNTYTTAPEQLSNDMAAFGKAIGDFKTGVDNLGLDTEVEADKNKALGIAEDIMLFFDEIIDYIPDGEGLISYNTKLSSFFSNMTTLGENVKTFKDKIQGLAKTEILADTGMALLNVGAIAVFLAGLSLMPIEESKGALAEWFTGKSATDTVIDQVATLGASVNTLQGNIDGISGTTLASDVGTMIPVVKAIAELLVWIAENGQSLKGYDPDQRNLDIFTSAMDQLRILSGAIFSFDADIKDVDSAKIDSLATSFSTFVKATVDLATLLSGTGETKLDSSHFLDGLDLDSIDKGLTEFVENAGQTILNSSDSLKGYISDFNSTGGTLAASLSYGIGYGNTDTTGIDGLMKDLLAAAKDYEDDFKLAGYYLGRGLGLGIKTSEAVAVAAAKWVASQVLKKIKEVFNENSPSKETQEIGRYAVIGLANGLSKFSSLATRSAEDLGNDTLNSTSNILSNLSDLISDNVDADPVIRPVVDLSNVSSGAKAIDNLFYNRGSMSIGGVRSRLMAGTIDINKYGKNQNGTTTQGQSVSSNETKFDFSNAQFHFSDKLDIRAWKMELDSLSRDEDRARGSVY